jgi:hypothetical protein
MGGGTGSVSGGGSSVEATATVRQQLPLIIQQFQIKSMLDLPCGDYYWMQTVDKNCDYIGGDIVPEMIQENQSRYAGDKVRFEMLDLTKDALPKVDLIFCKDCLQHLSYAKVHDALANCKRSGSKYLMVTSYPKTWRNYDILDGDYRPLNLRIRPFSLPRPILKVWEKSKVKDVEIDKTMYLYDLQRLNV